MNPLRRAGERVRATRVKSKTLNAERALQRTLRADAARRLGASASSEQVAALADQLYHGPTRTDAGHETPVQRRQRLRDAAGTIEELRKLNR